MSGKTSQQLPDIRVEFRAAGSPHRRVQADDQVAGRQVFALPPKNFACDALDQIAPIGALDQFLGHRHTQAGGSQLVWPIVERIETATQRTPESKNG